MNRWAIAKKLLPLIGISILIYLIINIGVGKIANAILTIKPLYLFLSIFLLIPFLFLQTYKWKFILNKQGIAMDFWYLFKVHLIGIFYAAITPGCVGTLARIGYINEESGEKIGKCFSNVLIDGIVDLIGLSILAICGSIILIKYSPILLLVTSILLIFILSSFLFFMKEEKGKKLYRVIKIFIPNKFENMADESFQSFYEQLPAAKELALPLLIAIFDWILVYSQAYIIAHSLSINVPYFYFITIYPIATIVGYLPITIGGLGTREATLVSLFSTWVTPEKVVVLSISAYIFSTLILVIMGMIASSTMIRRNDR